MRLFLPDLPGPVKELVVYAVLVVVLGVLALFIFALDWIMERVGSLFGKRGDEN